jgi:hypothetical protein
MATWFEITYTGEPTEADYARVAELAAQGCTSGQLLNDPEPAPDYWALMRARPHLTSAQLAELAGPELISAARRWALDCEWLDSDDIADMSDAHIVAGVNQHYEGGWAAFAAAEDV